MRSRWYQACFALVMLIAGLALCLPRDVAAQSSTSAVDIGVGVGDTVLQVSGQTAPGSFVTVMRQGATIGTIVADNSGFFSQAYPAQQPGITNLSFSAKDSDGKLTDTIDLQVNLQQHFPTEVQVFLPPTIALVSAFVAHDGQLEVSGMAAPGSTVRIYIDNREITSATAGSGGRWTARIAAAGLGQGPHELFARATLQGGDQSFPTASRAFVVAPPATAQPLPFPVAPATILPARPSAPTIDSPRPGQKLATGKVTILGRGNPLTQLEIWDNNKIRGSVIVSKQGTWRVELDFTEGDHEIRARSCLNNRCGEFSNNLLFTVINPPVTVPRNFQIELRDYRLQTTAGTAVSLQLQSTQGSPPYTVLVDWGDGTKSSFSTQTSTISVQHTYQKAGSYPGSITVTDADTSRKLFFTVRASEQSTDIWKLLVLVLPITTLLAASVYAFRKYWPGRKTAP